MSRSQESNVLLAFLALALLALMLLTANVAGLGSAVSREVQRAQFDYMRDMGSGELVENNALRLGQCLRKEMLKSARAGFVQPDSWAIDARMKAWPTCTQQLPRASPHGIEPIVPTVRARPIIAGGAPVGRRETLASGSQ